MRLKIVLLLAVCSALPQAWGQTSGKGNPTAACGASNLNTYYVDTANNQSWGCTATGWRSGVGFGTPAAESLACTSINFGNGYTDLTGNAGYSCSTSGWISGSGSSGTVTNIATGNGLTGGPISTTGTVSLVNPVNQTLEDNGTGGTTATPGQVFNIVSFGADPTGGSTIDTAFSNAQTSCGAHTYTGGCIIYFPPGRYLISSTGLSLSGNSITIMGANRGSTLTQAAPSTNTVEYMVQATGTNQRITGMTFAGQSTQATDNTTYQYCIQSNAASSLEVDNNIFTGTTPGTNGCNVGFFDEVGSTGTQFVLNNFPAPTIGTTGSKGYGVLLSGSGGQIYGNVINFSSTQGRHQIYFSQSATRIGFLLRHLE